MIRSIRHKGLKRLYEEGDPRGVLAEHVMKLCDILARLDVASEVTDMDLPGFWAVTVRANWRVMFRFTDHNVLDLDYVDYH